MAQYIITKKVAKHGKQAVIVIPRLLEEELKPGTVVKLTLDVVKEVEMKTIKNTLRILSAAVALASAPAYADSSLFAGNITSRDSKGSLTLDTLANAKSDNGSEVIVEATNINPNEDSRSNNFSLGIRSPKVVNNNLRLNAAIDYKDTQPATGSRSTTASHTTFAEALPSNTLTLRAGFFGTQDSRYGEFVGAKNVSDNTTLDLDVWHDGTNFNTKGFVAYTAGGFYGSIGSDPRAQNINLVNGWMDKNNPCYVLRATVNPKTKSQIFKLTLVDAFTPERRHLDFRSHRANGTEMRGVATGYILDSWAPFDAWDSNRYATVIKGTNEPNVASGSIAVYRNISHGPSGTFVGLSAKVNHDKTSATTTIRPEAEFYSGIPRTPLDAWIDISVDSKNPKDVAGIVYLGVSL